MSLSDFTSPLSETLLNTIYAAIDEWVLYLSVGLFAMELIRYAVAKRLGWNVAGDSAANVTVFAAYLGLSYVVFFGIYIWVFYTAYAFAPVQIETTWLSLAACVVLLDFAYYWEHRFTHRVGMAGATHSVHHSSPHFNISVAYRFGPMDDVWAIVFYTPLCLIGFDPLVVFLSSAIVLQYQTFLHTEAVGKLPRWIEAVMNTPSHHRVHHGSNPRYLDKNYAGMFIVWDRLFGTFAREEEKVTFGLVEPINSNNPFIVFLHGIHRLGNAIAGTQGAGNKLARLVMPPDWQPSARR